MISEDKTIDRISNAFGLITFGVVALLVSLGNIPLENLFMFFLKFWPVFVIFGGFKLLVSALPFGKIINLVVDILFDLAIVFTLIFLPSIESRLATRFPYFDNRSTTVSVEKLDIKADKYAKENIKSIDFGLKIGASTFTLTDSDSPDYLITAGSYTKELFTPEISSELKDKELKMIFKQSPVNSMKLGMFRNMYSQFDFILGNNKLPLNLEIGLGAGNGDIELNNENIKGIKIDVGAGNLAMSLPSSQEYIFKYDVGAGRVKISKGGETLKSVTGFSSNTSYKYGTDAKTIVDINVGAGNVEIVLK